MAQGEHEMKESARAAVILSIGLMVAGFLSGGVYSLSVATDKDGIEYAYRLNRLTGSVSRIVGNTMFNIRTIQADWNKETPTPTPTASN